MLRPSTIILLTCGSARETVPRFPLSLPVVIRTVSPFLMFILVRWRGFFSFCLVAILSLLRLSLSHFSHDKLQRRTTNKMSALQHFGRERNDLHKVSFAQFAGHRSEDTSATRVIASRDNDGGVLVKA